MTREQAIELAKEHAQESITHYNYLDDVNSDDWMPHEWVIEAILSAANE